MLFREVFVAGVPKPFNVPGNYFRVKRVTGPALESLTCNLFRGGQRLPESLDFADAGDFAYVPQGFDRVEITSTVAQTVTIQIARGRVGTDRVTGEVLAISGEVQRSKNEQSFMGRIAVTAIAGDTAYVQLWNPAASGVRGVVNQVTATLTNGTNLGFVLKNYDVALLTLGASSSNKNAGGPAPVLQLRSLSDFGIVGNTWGKFFPAALGISLGYQPTEPFILGEGRGVILETVALAQTIEATFEHWEEPL